MKALKHLTERGATLKQIGEALGRHISSVNKKRNDLGIYVQKRWTKDEEDAMWEMRSEGAAYAEIAKKLGRTRGAVEQRMIETRAKKRAQMPMPKRRLKDGLAKKARDSEPYMTEAEIAGKVRRGVDIKALAELNLTTKKKILQIAKKNGVEVGMTK